MNSAPGMWHVGIRAFRRKREDDGDDAQLAGEIDTVLTVLARYPAGTSISFGAPTRCPRCSDYGMVDHVDRVQGRAWNRCLRCAHEWVISVRALRAARTMGVPGVAVGGSFPTVDPQVAATSGGVLFSLDGTGEVKRQTMTPWGVPTPSDVPQPSSVRAGATDGAPLKILLVEDDLGDIEVVRAILEPAAEGTVDLRTAGTRADGEAAARRTEPDLILLDLGLPDSHGLATVTQWHFNATAAPVLIVSGQYGDEIVDRGAELGVTGFMDKSELAMLLELGDEGTTRFLDRLASAAAG